MAQQFSRTGKACKGGLPLWWEAYFTALAAVGNRTAACRTAGIDRTTPAAYLKDHPESREDFERRTHEAIDQAADGLEMEARRRAQVGVSEPVFYKGRQCGAVQRYSDTLLIFLLKAARPEVYRDNVRVTGQLKLTIEELILEAAGAGDGDAG